MRFIVPGAGFSDKFNKKINQRWHRVVSLDNYLEKFK